MSPISRYYDADLDMWIPASIARFWGDWFGPAWRKERALVSQGLTVGTRRASTDAK